MKKIIAFIMLLIVTATSFSQQTKSSLTLTKQDYLEKSKNQKKAARILLYGGAACIGISFLIPQGEVTNDILFALHKNDAVKVTFFFSGFLSTLISIPVFIASHRNKKKSMLLSFKNETVPQLQKNSFVTRSVPSFSLKISL